MTDLNLIVMIIQLVLAFVTLALASIFVYAWWYERRQHAVLVERSLDITQTSQALEEERNKNQLLSLQLEEKKLTISERDALLKRRRGSDVQHSHPDILDGI